MARSLRYEFNLEKFVAVLGYLVKRCGPMTKLKAAKLLYLADRRHFNLHGRPIIGDSYFRLDYGPVPSKALDLLDELIEAQGPTLATWLRAEGKTLSRHFVVKASGVHPSIGVKGEPKLDVLSRSELAALEWVAAQFGKKSAGQLVDITHRHASWKETAPVKEIDYRLFPKDDPDAVRGVAEIAEFEQVEHDELFSAMSGETSRRGA